MESNALKRLPVGIQTYEKIVEQDCLYIDKTAFIPKMMALSNYVFLNRPRRFGKSLLVSTLQAYFEGRRELFKGCYIDSVEKDWTAYPVLRFDMSQAKHLEKEELERYLHHLLDENEARFGLTSNSVDTNLRLATLIQAVYRQTGRQVVVLIDEYDAPLLDVTYTDEQLEELRHIMDNFYSPLKAADPYLKFVFMTGITKFAPQTIYSGLNNLKNISMLPDFAAVCGITEEEVVTQMAPYLDRLAEAKHLTRNEALAAIRRQYDGYHFTWPSPDIFNPFSLLNAMQDRMLKNYWFESGTTTFLVELLRKFGNVFTDIKRIDALACDFDAPTEYAPSIIPLLYQSGYITIKDYDEDFDFYTLDIPNQEVRIGLTRSLIPSYITPDSLVVDNTARRMAQRLTLGDIDGALTLLRDFLLTVPYCNDANSEGHYQQVLYIIFTLVTGYFVDVEVRTATGRVDMVLRTDKALYLFELKLNKSAEAAMDQIKQKDYPARFALGGLPIIRVGINFDTEQHTITAWQIEEEKRPVEK
ncbi:MAG: ATP-binding protein [Prevotella sp.]|nr:ATP-binding protein [Prevotella sp.]